MEVGAGLLLYYKDLLSLSITVGIGAVVTKYIQHQFKVREKKDAEIRKLQEEKEELKEKAIQEWRELYSGQLISVRDAQTKILDLLNRHEKRLVRLEIQKEGR